MTFKMNEEAQTITIYNLRSDTNEFIGSGDAYIPPHTGLPAHCTDIEPPDTKNGEVAVFDGKAWSLLEDHRETVVYDTTTGAEVFIIDLGPLPSNTTTIAPDNPLQKWNGTGWEDDEQAIKDYYHTKVEQDRSALLNEANTVTSDWRTELLLGYISDSDKELLSKWMAYIKTLKGWDTSTVTTEYEYDSFVWPDKVE